MSSTSLCHDKLKAPDAYRWITTRKGVDSNGDVWGWTEINARGTPITLSTNGWIYDPNGNLLCPDTPLVVSCYTEAEALEAIGTRQHTISPTYDSTKIRLFYDYTYQKWRVATNRCIDANNAYYDSDESFGSVFWSLFDSEDLKSLDASFVYVFVVANGPFASRGLEFTACIHRWNLATYDTTQCGTTGVLTKYTRLAESAYQPRGKIYKVVDSHTRVYEMYSVDNPEFILDNATKIIRNLIDNYVCVLGDDGLKNSFKKIHLDSKSVLAPRLAATIGRFHDSTKRLSVHLYEKIS